MRKLIQIAAGVGLGVFLGFSSPLQAQSYGDDPFRDLGFQERRRVDGPDWIPPLTLRIRRQVAVPGPLPAGVLEVDEPGRVRLRLHDGEAVVDLEDGGYHLLRGETELPAADGGAAVVLDWVVSPDGRRRFRTHPEGLIESQKACRSCRKGWRKRWKLRIPGGSVAPPLVTDDAVFVGALDNRLYALRSRNGHRLWDRDMGKRLSFPPVLWEGSFPTKPADEPPARLVAIVPDGGREIRVFEAISGEQVAEYKLLEGEDRLVGPVAVDGGTIVAPLQSYVRNDAALLLLELVPRVEAPNPGEPAEAQSSE